MEEILKLIERYGLTLILLLGSLYALYKFFIFSIKYWIEYNKYKLVFINSFSELIINKERFWVVAIATSVSTLIIEYLVQLDQESCG